MRYKNSLIFGFFALFFVACASEEVVQNDFHFEPYKEDDKITLQSINGGSKTLVRTIEGFVVEGEEDKALMLDFFGTFCTPCKEEAADLTRLYKDNIENFILIGLSHFEEVSDEALKEFADKYGAYYFLSNSKENARIISQALQDIKYPNMEQLPFKLVLKNGEYQLLSDFYNEGAKVNFYLGKVPAKLMQQDLERIISLAKN